MLLIQSQAVNAIIGIFREICENPEYVLNLVQLKDQMLLAINFIEFRH